LTKVLGIIRENNAMRLFLKAIKNFFVIPVPDNYKEEFKIAVAKTNITNAKAVSLALILMEVIMIIASIFIKKELLLKPPDIYYLIMYLLMIAVMAVFWKVFTALGKDIVKNSRKITCAGVVFLSSILFWCAGISLLDQLSYGQIVIYLSAIISVAVVALFPPLVFLINYAAVHIFFIIALPSFPQSDTTTFGNIINSTLFIILSIIIARMRYKEYIDDFKNIKTIQEKNEEIERINTELKTLNQELEKLSQTDSLTGVFNRSAFDDILKREWNRCKRSSMPLSLLMADIDQLKEINDNYGHQTGDDCIRKMAKVLTSSVKRSSETVCRYGGDEFAVILPNITEEKAEELARLLEDNAVKEIDIYTDPDFLTHITVSIGAATVIPSDNSSISELINAADKKLYEIKKKHRGLTEI